MVAVHCPIIMRTHDTDIGISIDDVMILLFHPPTPSLVICMFCLLPARCVWNSHLILFCNMLMTIIRPVNWRLITGMHKHMTTFTEVELPTAVEGHLDLPSFCVRSRTHAHEWSFFFFSVFVSLFEVRCYYGIAFISRKSRWEWMAPQKKKFLKGKLLI